MRSVTIFLYEEGLNMKTKAMLVLALAMLSQNGVSQVTSVDADIDAELSQMYQNQTTAGSVATPQAAPVAQYNQYNVVPSYQKQPTTVIEASPLSDSRAEQIRKNRQEEELRTESRIVEKLEQSRIEDEKRRASVLFGDKFDSLQNNGQQHVPVQTPAAPATQPVQPIIIHQPVENDEASARDLVRDEVRAALDEESSAVEAPLETRYFGGVVGISEYPDTPNIKSNYTLGATFGSKYDALMLEGSFFVSNFDLQMVNNYYYRYENYEINQFTGAVAVKYQLFQGIVRPVVGGTMAYSYRNFTYVDYGLNEDTGNSHAVDFGAIAGVDLEFTSKMSLGLEFRYMFNLLSRVNANNPNGGVNYGYANNNTTYSGPALEKLQYYLIAVTGRVNF